MKHVDFDRSDFHQQIFIIVSLVTSNAEEQGSTLQIRVIIKSCIITIVESIKGNHSTRINNRIETVMYVVYCKASRDTKVECKCSIIWARSLMRATARSLKSASEGKWPDWLFDL